MAAKKGNKYAEGKGRPRKVNAKDLSAFQEDMLAWFREKFEDFREEMREYLSAKDPKRPLIDVPTLDEYSKMCGVSYRTLRDYCEQDESFSQTWKLCKDYQARYITLAAMNGLSNPSFSIFAAMNYGNMRQKNQLTGADDQALSIKFDSSFDESPSKTA